MSQNLQFRTLRVFLEEEGYSSEDFTNEEMSQLYNAFHDRLAKLNK